MKRNTEGCDLHLGGDDVWRQRLEGSMGGRRAPKADGKTPRQAEQGPTKLCFSLHADGTSDMKQAGTKLTNQAYLSKPELAQEVYSSSAP